MLRRFVTTFMAGVLALLPLLVTVLAISFLVGKLADWIGPQSAFGRWVTGVSPEDAAAADPTLNYVVALLLVIIAVWVVGAFARRITGRRIGMLIEALIGRIPFINKIYSSTDQVVALLSHREGDAAAALSSVVLCRLGNIRVMGMLSSPQPVVIDGVDHFIVFLPSTPIPASGQNVIVPAEDVRPLDLTVEEMTKILVSLGSLGPGILSGRTGGGESTAVEQQ
jgi:uncharacterized membrane protein